MNTKRTRIRCISANLAFTQEAPTGTHRRSLNAAALPAFSKKAWEQGGRRYDDAMHLYLNDGKRGSREIRTRWETSPVRGIHAAPPYDFFMEGTPRLNTRQEVETFLTTLSTRLSQVLYHLRVKSNERRIRSAITKTLEPPLFIESPRSSNTKIIRITRAAVQTALAQETHRALNKRFIENIDPPNIIFERRGLHRENNLDYAHLIPL